MITALYVALTYACFSFSYGVIQIRISEILTVLPLLYPESIIGLSLGCLLADIGSPFGYLDILIGTGTTLLASLGTYFAGRKIKNLYARFFVGGLFPILLNALLIPVVWYLAGGEELYFVNAASVGISQILCVYGLGLPFYLAIGKLKQKGIKGFAE